MSDQYTFLEVTHCNMCQASVDGFQLLGKRLNKSQGFLPSKKVGITVSIIKCKHCGLIFSSPMPIPKLIGDHYNLDPLKYWNGEPYKKDPSYFSSEIQWLMKLRPDWEKKVKKSLDIGAGLGKQMMALQRIGFETYGIEPSETFYEVAIEKMGLSKSNLFFSSVEDASFDEDSFDFISFGAVLEHLSNPSEAIVKALDWLRPDGLIHIEVPSSNWLTARIINFMYRLRGLDYVTNLSPMHPPFHLYEFSARSFQMNGKIHDFEVLDYKYYVCRTYLPAFVDPLAKLLMRHTNTGMQLCVWLQKNINRSN